MSGEWIKIETSITTKPEVYAIARKLGVSVDAAVGYLVKFWIWADQSTVDGHVDHMQSTDVDHVVDRDGFANALIDVKWLVVDVSGTGFEIPKFSRHNGESAKKRALKNEAQARWRKGLRQIDSNSGAGENVENDVDAPRSTKGSTREEKRREEENLTLMSSSQANIDPAQSADEDQPEPKITLANGKQKHLGSAIQVLEFLNLKTGRHYRPTAANLTLIAERLKEGASEDECRIVVARQVQKWTGTDMADYLRPATLFNRTKFNQYLGEVPR